MMTDDESFTCAGCGKPVHLQVEFQGKTLVDTWRDEKGYRFHMSPWPFLWVPHVAVEENTLNKRVK